jgi:hypothetical protein
MANLNATKNKVTFISIIASLGALLRGFSGNGAIPKEISRYGIPVVIAACAFNKLQNLWVITILGMIGIFSMGYGLPSPTDKGSALGKFFYKLCKQKEVLANLLTRGWLGVLKSLVVISVPVLKHNWITYAITTFVCVLVNVLFGGGTIIKVGTFKLFGKQLNWEEIIIMFSDITTALCVVYF